MEFANVAHLFFYFNEFDAPMLNGVLTKKDILLSLEDSSLPTFLTPRYVDSIF